MQNLRIAAILLLVCGLIWVIAIFWPGRSGLVSEWTTFGLAMLIFVLLAVGIWLQHRWAWSVGVVFSIVVGFSSLIISLAVIFAPDRVASRLALIVVIIMSSLGALALLLSRPAKRQLFSEGTRPRMPIAAAAPAMFIGWLSAAPASIWLFAVSAFEPGPCDDACVIFVMLLLFSTSASSVVGSIVGAYVGRNAAKGQGMLRWGKVMIDQGAWVGGFVGGFLGALIGGILLIISPR